MQVRFTIEGFQRRLYRFEIDIDHVKVGQTASITFDAIPNKTFNGIVQEVSQAGDTSSGAVNFTVTVQLTDADVAVKPGMTVAVTIVTKQIQDQLLVPNRAVRTVSTRLRTATVLYEGQLIDVPVTLGLTGDTQSEVLSGLQEGDVVLTSQTTTTTRAPGVGGLFLFGR